jgi:O-antigen/teichoic acid export membrane protein
MSEAESMRGPNEGSQPTPPSDLTGRDRLAWNVLASWAGHAVIIVTGFIMPRFIDYHIGQTALGVWDFGWSVVTYFGLAQLGVGSATNRYVAAHRSAGDIEGVNRTASAVMCVQFVATMVVVVLAVIAAWQVPALLTHRLGDFVSDARWVILFLGLTIAAQLPLGAFSGILTGYHRWDLYSAVNTGGHAGIIVAMIVALSFGGGLRSLAIASFLGTLVSEVLRAWVAYQICPGLRINPFRVCRADIRKLVMFGGKTVINSMSGLLMYQTSSLLVIGFLGPAALAIYARPTALVRHVQTLVSKLAFVLTPIAGALDASGQQSELRTLLVRSTRYSMYLTLPLLLPLLVFGDTIMRVWMGPNYEGLAVVAILAIGHLLSVPQQSAVTILIGMNLHGRVAVANLLAALFAVVLGFLTLGVLQWGLIGAALSITIPLTLSGLYVPLYACRQTDLPLRKYLIRAFGGSLLAAIPYLVCLVAARVLFRNSPVFALGGGMAVGVLALAPIYWSSVVPEHMRTTMTSVLRRRVGWPLLPPRYDPHG